MLVLIAVVKAVKTIEAVEAIELQLQWLMMTETWVLNLPTGECKRQKKRWMIKCGHPGRFTDIHLDLSGHKGKLLSAGNTRCVFFVSSLPFSGRKFSAMKITRNCLSHAF